MRLEGNWSCCGPIPSNVTDGAIVFWKPSSSPRLLNFPLELEIGGHMASSDKMTPKWRPYNICERFEVRKRLFKLWHRTSGVIIVMARLRNTSPYYSFLFSY